MSEQAAMAKAADSLVVPLELALLVTQAFKPASADAESKPPDMTSRVRREIRGETDLERRRGAMTNENFKKRGGNVLDVQQSGWVGV